MSEGKYSAITLLKNFLLILFLLVILVLARPSFYAVYGAIDHNVVISLVENVVKEGEKDKLYGVDQIYSYLQKGLNDKNVKLNAKEIIKAENAGNYLNLIVDYRVDNKIFGNFNLSNVYHQSYKANLK